MPLEELVKEIQGEAQKNVASIESQAEHDADTILSEAHEKAKELMKKEKDGIAANTERIMKQNRSSLEVEKRKLSMEAKEEAVERELKQVKKEVAKELQRNYMKKLLDTALKEFADRVPKGETTVVTSRANAKFIDRSGYKVEYESSVDGFMLQSRDKQITLNAEIGRIVEAHKELIRNLLSKRLFEKGR